MHQDAKEARNTRRIRALALLGGLTLEAAIFALLLTASPTLEPVHASPADLEITCESVHWAVEAGV
jgi:hypothetical protein